MAKFFFTFLMGLIFLVPLHPAHPHEVNGVENHSMVDILDPELRKIVADRLAKAPTDPITADDMKTLTNVFTGGNGPDIRHLRGLEHAINLTSLQLLRPPPRTQAELNARPFWQTADLEPLTGLTKLEHLTIQGSVVFDMTPIANLTNLRDVAFNYTYGISRIPDLSKLTELVHLRLDTNQITDISGVRGLTNLRQLRLESNRGLSDITPLTQLSTLEILRLDNTLVTHESLSAVLPFMSTEIDQMIIDEYPPTSITSGEFGISGTNISDLSVLDNFPDVFLHGLYLRFLGSIPDRTFPFHLKDLTPLVDLMNKGKVINGKTSIYLLYNYGLDYESLYEDIPALLANTTGRTVNWPKVGYSPPSPMLEREFPTAASYTGSSRSRATFKVRAINTNPDFPAGWVSLTPHGTGENRQFAKVPVTWKVTAPDGTVSEQKVPTGDDGLSNFVFTPGKAGNYTIEAVVPAKTTSGLRVYPNPNYPNPNMALSHEELKVTFTATIIDITLTFDNATYTDIQWVADVSGPPPLPESYAYYYKKSANRAWIKVTDLGYSPSRFSFIHSELQPGTSYDFQLFGLRGEDRIESNVLTARTLSRTPPRPPPPEPPPEPQVSLNRPPVFTSASAVRVAENTIAIIRIVAEDPDTNDEIMNYAMTGGADQAMLEIGGTRSPSDMLRFKAAPDFENPQDADMDNVCIVILRATSGVGNRELTATQTLTVTVTDVDEPVEPPVESPPVEPPVESPVEPPVQPPIEPPVEPPVQPPVEPPVEPPVDAPVGPSVGSGGAGTRPPIPLGAQVFIFNEIGNFSDDRNDWIELKNVCHTPLDLSEWQIRLITTYDVASGAEIDVVSFPDFLLPAQGVLLVTNADPSRTPLASGLNIATGARSRGAQHPYFVAPDLKLPTTPFLLILQRVGSANSNTTPTLIDVAGNYFWEVLPDGSEVYAYTYTPDTSDVGASTAPLTDLGVWQRQRLEQPGYLSAAWGPSGYHGGIGYDRDVPVSVSLGTPGYRRDPSPSQPVAYRLVFNEIRNASNDTHDWVELKNVCGEGVRLKHWHISIVVNRGGAEEESVDIVSFPDYTVPMGGVLLITNTDPSETVLADGLNIATGGRQKGAQHAYLVAPDLKLPSTPYLLILEEVRQVPADGERTIADVAGNYALTAVPNGTALYPHLNVSRPMEPLAPLARFGAWQRRHFVEQPGYLAAAWEPSGYHGGIGYDRDAPPSVCLGTPGYRQDPSPVLPVVTQRLVFNKIHNATDNADDTIDYIELKNISDTGVHLKYWTISSIASTGENADEDVDIVSFPNWTLPAGGVLLILNKDPGPVIFDGRNIATDAQQTDAQQTDAQRDYFVAPDLQLPETPYLLILRHAPGKNGTPESIEDVAGDYFRSLNNTQVWPLAHTLRPSAPAAPLSEAGTYQRKDARQHGYLATAWTTIASPLYAYAPDAFATLPVTQRLVFNKIRNAANDTHDWIELKNISDTAVQLEDWAISSVASAGENADEDVGMVSFPYWTLPAAGVLLITNTEPDETVIVDGLNITPGASQQPGAEHPYLVAPDLRLPETPYLLILRHAPGKNGTPESIEDVAGNYFRTYNATEVWPLADTRHPGAPAAPLSEVGTWQRKDASEIGYLAAAWTVTHSPPGIGTAPNAPENRRNALFAPDANAAVIFNPTLPDEVRITELMFETKGPSETLPQWIELYNASATPVDLEGWQLVVETRTDSTHRHAALTLHPLEIPPKQTVLLVKRRGRHSAVLPDRVYALSEMHPEAFSRRHLSNTLLSRDGFSLQLLHPTGRVVDTCGTLDGDKDTDDLPTWTLPDGKTPHGHRFSLLRRFDGDVRKGTKASGWQRAADVAMAVTRYYGHPTDISSPGGLHQIVPGASPTVALSISEILFTAPTRTPYPHPQWIELYNPSFTEPVNLKDFQCVIETRQDGKHHQLVIDLEVMAVLPNQTVLLITGQGRHSGHFPANRTYNLSQRHPKAFRSPELYQRLLGSEAFLIQLTDATGNVVDTVGNLDGYPFTEDTPAWALPDGETPEGARASIRRLYKKRIPLDGRHSEAWVSTATVPPVIMTYYGHHSDVGNPGYRMGGPLPVVLSSFRAVRDTDTVAVSWTTESSLENAGFHLYRSTQRTGGFIRVNPRLIQGAGTTTERQTYTYVDRPPKADGVYYYQIEEVSYSGQQQVLATARLRGHLSAEGKHLTTLGDMKKGGGVKDKEHLNAFGGP